MDGLTIDGNGIGCRVDFLAAVAADGAIDSHVPAFAQFLEFPPRPPARMAQEDNVSPTVIGLLPRQYQGAGLFPVGRLDKDTTGLLLITNDGTWAHGITSPKKHTDKIYDAVVEGDIPEDVGDRFASGIVLDDGLHCLPAKAVQTGPRSLTVVVQEGKFHQVKRMCAAVGLKVVQLHRRSIGSVVLDDGLEPGQFRPLTDEEREALRSQSR